MILSLILSFVCGQTGESIEVIYQDQPGYTKWIAGLSNNSSSDAIMYCPTSCPSEEEDRIRIIEIFFSHKGRYRCCASQAAPFYHFFPYKSNVRENVLFVEYSSALGDARFVYKENKSNAEHTFTKCRHSHGYLSSIPDNKCTFPSILELDLSDNQIKTIGNLSCLTFLSVLDLRENRISYIRKGTFDKLYYLWKINLSFNDIAWIDQSTLQSPHLQLKDMNFQSQRGTLTKVNISNLYPERVFHLVDFSNNCIDEIINCDVDGPYPSCYSNWSITTFIEHEDHRRGGRITAIPRSFLRNLEKASSIDLRGNPITIVPSVLRGLFLRTCVLKIDAVVPCTCSELWLRDWLMNHDCGDDIGITYRDTGLSIRYIIEFDVCEK
uniref:Uncharacterized protein n=1 Tax=Magallana gigas TaxID=29159 RepID=K1RDL6_MAGGI